MILLFAIFAFGSLALTWLLTGLVLKLLMRFRIVDRPNERSSHPRLKVVGGGWALIGAMMILLPPLAWLMGETTRIVWLIAGIALLTIISWLDDIRELRAGPRFLVQLSAVACGMMALPDNYMFGWLVPHWLEQSILVLSWTWFLNLYNFMDGIDGITGGETLTIGVSILMLAMLVVLPPIIPLTAAILIGMALGWLSWNWAPAKLFLGDVGSVPLGFVVGWLLLYTAHSGYVVAAAIPMLYYGFDTTWTLLRRIVQRKPFWHAHREFFFHRALEGVQGFHSLVVQRLLVANMALMPCVWLAAYKGAWALIPASAIVLGLVYEYKRLYRIGTQQGRLQLDD